MANAYTDIASGVSLGNNLVKTAYDRMVEFNLRTQPFFRQIADKRPAQQSMPGQTIVFNLYVDLAPATTPLNEVVDPDTIAIPQTTQVTVTLQEYGSATLATRKLRLFALSDVDPAVADIVSFNMLDSLDNVIRDVVRVGTQVIREQGGVMKPVGVTSALASITATDVFQSRDVRAAVAKLRGLAVMPLSGSDYVGYIHPDQSYDLRSGTAGADWRPPNANGASQDRIWSGSIGEYEGVEWIESPRVYRATDGASSAPVYRALVFGRQALAEAVAQEPGVVFGPITDRLNRFRPVGWYGVLGWSIYRDQSIVRIETSTSLQ